MTTNRKEWTAEEVRRERDELGNRLEELCVLAGMMARAKEGNDAYYEEHALPLLEMLERGLRAAVDDLFSMPVGGIAKPIPETEAAWPGAQP